MPSCLFVERRGTWHTQIGRIHRRSSSVSLSGCAYLTIRTVPHHRALHTYLPVWTSDSNSTVTTILFFWNTCHQAPSSLPRGRRSGWWRRGTILVVGHVGGGGGESALGCAPHRAREEEGGMMISGVREQRRNCRLRTPEPALEGEPDASGANGGPTRRAAPKVRFKPQEI